MGRDVLAGPPGDFITPGEARSWLREESLSEEGVLAALIPAARTLVEMDTGLDLRPLDIAEYQDEWPRTGALILAAAPVREVVSVAVMGSEGESLALDASHYAADLTGRPARLWLRPGRGLPQVGVPSGGIRIVLKVGFTRLPEALRQAWLIRLQGLVALRLGEAPPPLSDYRRLIAPHQAVRL